MVPKRDASAAEVLGRNMPLWAAAISACVVGDKRLFGPIKKVVESQGNTIESYMLSLLQALLQDMAHANADLSQLRHIHDRAGLSAVKLSQLWLCCAYLPLRVYKHRKSVPTLAKLETKYIERAREFGARLGVEDEHIVSYDMLGILLQGIYSERERFVLRSAQKSYWSIMDLLAEHYYPIKRANMCNQTSQLSNILPPDFARYFIQA